MSKLEEITVGSHVSGLASNESVQIVAVNWYGSSVLDVVFKNAQGALGNQLLYREDETHLQVLEDKLPWSFDADGDTMRLVSEAYRINLAHLFDPYLAVHTSSVEPLPHQISAEQEPGLDVMIFHKLRDIIPVQPALRTDGNQEAEPRRLAVFRGFRENQPV